MVDNKKELTYRDLCTNLSLVHQSHKPLYINYQRLITPKMGTRLVPTGTNKTPGFVAKNAH